MIRKAVLFLIAGVFVAAGFVPEVMAEEGFIQIRGSDTEVNLVQHLAEVYMDKNPEVYIAVTGGGSGTGIAALINGKIDIANVSRKNLSNASRYLSFHLN